MSETSAINMAHQAHHERQIAAHERITVPSVIARPDTIDAWRHVRMYAPIHSLVAHDPDRSWLTIGDSGADAHWLRSIGAREVTASSISATSLERLKAEGYLDGVDVAAINAERIARDDDSVDFVLCKEAYHHLARPMVGFYEMLRVSRVATILLAEPDGSAGSRPLDWLKSGVKTVLRRGPAQSNRFEPAGNFIYGVALEELWKAATAIQARHVYYTRLNDFFHERISRYPMSSLAPRMITGAALAVQDALSRLRLMSWGSVTVIFFKGAPSRDLRAALAAAGMKRMNIPVNPFL